MDLKIIFMGTPEFSVPTLKGLIENYGVEAVVTQPDKPVGRGGKLKFSPIKEVALENNILCLQPNKMKEVIDEIRKMKPDLIITCAYGKILPKSILDIPRLGCINVHGSLLPKLRGGAPIHHAIIDGYDETGITIMYMAEGMDSGDIISQKSIKIEESDTVDTLHDKLMILGKDLLLETLPSIINKTNKRIVQDESEVTYGYNILREDEKIDFNKTLKEVYNQIRGLNSFPGAYTLLDNKTIKVYGVRKAAHKYENAKNGEIVNIYKDGLGVKVSDGEIIFEEIKLEGKRKMKVSDFLNGNHEQLKGKILG